MPSHMKQWILSLSLLLVCLQGGMSPKISDVFQFFLSRKICAGYCLNTKDKSGYPSTNPCLSVRRLQSMVGIELAACYVTSRWVFSWHHAADTSTTSLA